MVKGKVGRLPGELGASRSTECHTFSLQCPDTAGFGDRKGNWPTKKSGRWFVWWRRLDWSVARLRVFKLQPGIFCNTAEASVFLSSRVLWRRTTAIST